ncbi:Cys-tRNA(Pro) deacylase [Thiorhodovibrio frisius]|uniref:Cys-tRNA(Pro)/Cys-tRNA(Cys) deacylase n=1 Tax=Thiorhodovibrio frisius TaxID=631362 RepID=H8YVP4_9GAMM|nr:Cys-tRNA(Pro) deacylase [Thiorhodovibrio frisius]EIC23984.1 ybaK/ebsC protein [Thiorhodovibrio frisius]WPL23057.1 Cys-tRNA(Pro)/Cys-tRNA(Cys) deacylase YbaK [Thiorhodovibrio frisius]
MTPAIDTLKRLGIAHRVHAYHHDPGTTAYGQEAADQLGLDPALVFKTLVVSLDTKTLVVAIVPVSRQLSLKALAKAAGGKKAAMAEKAQAERSTGYLLGGISPIGQKRRLDTFVDRSAEALDRLFVSAGRRGLEIELSPADLQRVTKARFYDLVS